MCTYTKIFGTQEVKIQFSVHLQISRYAKRQENVAHEKEDNYSIKTVIEWLQMLELATKTLNSSDDGTPCLNS